MTDLFLSSKDRLWNFIKKKGYARSSDILRWGVENHSNRALRNARQLAREGRICKMSEARKIRLFGNCREAVWEIISWTQTPVTQLGGYVR